VNREFLSSTSARPFANRKFLSSTSVRLFANGKFLSSTSTGVFANRKSPSSRSDSLFVDWRIVFRYCSPQFDLEVVVGFCFFSAFSVVLGQVIETAGHLVGRST